MTIDSTRRNVLKAVGSAGALLAVGGVGVAGARKRTGASGDQTIVDIAQSNPDFSILVQAVVKAGLVDALSGNRQLTVFAPTNQAFLDLLAESEDYDGLDDIPEEVLRSILLYHVTSGRRYASSVLNAPRVRMLNGGSVHVDGTELNDDQANIVGTDIEASNGVVHVIDGVLLPKA